MTKLAIREALLPGRTVSERLGLARELGFSGVEFAAAGLDARIDEIDESLRAHALVASGLNLGETDGWVSSDIGRRRRANDMLREALACALDLEADYVTFAPQLGAGDMPDLTPFASPLELQKELLIWLLRGFSDLADAMDAKLALLPLNRGKTAFLTRLEQAAAFCGAVDDHPMITVAASIGEMALEEQALLPCLEAHIDRISVIYLADRNQGLPGTGGLPFPAIGATLRELDYEGWLVIDGRASKSGREGFSEFAACLDFLRDCGLQ
ncbi:MAG: sugar phosphate isomerase/epimerase [Chloroflexota bacterium]|nr:sugar phosphate isomerase/epimerase [Chloroflexota bacterium]MDE2909895.1 sugar phosphate isomerase/epimerase [Chloroflexota bacterium]